MWLPTRDSFIFNFDSRLTTLVHPCFRSSSSGAVLYSIGIDGLDPCSDFSPSEDAQQCVGAKPAFTTFSSTMSNLAVFVFSFTCHQNIFTVCNELSPSNRQRNVDLVILVAIGASLCLYLLVAWSGLLTFGDSLQSDILLNYPQSALVTTMRVFVALLVVFSYPLQLDPSRRCIITLVKKVRGRGTPRSPSSGVLSMGYDAEAQAPSDKTPLTSSTPPGGEGAGDAALFYVITLAFLLASYTLAMVVDSLGLILNVVGATGSTMVSYILPGIVYVRLFEGERDLTMVGARVQAAIGGCIIPVALYFIFAGSGGG